MNISKLTHSHPEGSLNQSFGSLWKNDTVFSSGPLALMYWTKEIPLLRFLVTPHLNTSLHLKQPGLRERGVDNLSRAMNECDQDSKNGYDSDFSIPLSCLILSFLERSAPPGKPPANHFSEQDHARRLCH